MNLILQLDIIKSEILGIVVTYLEGFSSILVVIYHGVQTAEYSGKIATPEIGKVTKSVFPLPREIASMLDADCFCIHLLLMENDEPYDFLSLCFCI